MEEVNSQMFTYSFLPLWTLLSQGNLAFPSFKGLWVCTLAQVWELIHGPRLTFFFMCLKSFLTYIDQTNFSRFFINFMPGNTKIPNKSCHYKIHVACADHYGLGHYGHCFICASHYNSYDHLAFGNSGLPLGPCYHRAKLNPFLLAQG